jgi:cold shock CspA family protein
MQYFVFKLVELRKSLKEQDIAGADAIRNELLGTTLKQFLTQWHEKQSGEGTEYGWLYILSTRKQPDILKIGMTTRSVPERVQEINSATGVLHPYSARAVFKVKRAREAERKVFKLLSDYRIREDREFFYIPFSKATQLIEEELFTERALKREHGQVIWFNQSKGYGFLKYEQQERLFFHISEVLDKNVESLKPGQKVEFDLMASDKGLKATNVVVVQS